MELKGHIFLIGFMGVGKTSTSKVLSKKLSVREVDTDAMIVEKEGRSITDIFAQDGETYFRQVETSMLDELAGKNLVSYLVVAVWQCAKKT